MTRSILSILSLFAPCALFACAEPRSQADTTAGSESSASARIEVSTIALPGGEGGIGFDDLRYSPRLRRVLVPAGRTGAVDLVDLATGEVEAIRGFSSKDTYS